MFLGGVFTIFELRFKAGGLDNTELGDGVLVT